MTKGTFNFLCAELEAARTFVAVAKQAKLEDKIARSVTNARKACEVTRHFIGRVVLCEDEAAEIGTTLASVENELAALEESFSRNTERTAGEAEI